MKNNILLIVFISLVFVAFYLLYSKQNNLEKKVLEQIALIKAENNSNKEDTKENKYSLDYKENNLIINKTINFADSINKLINDQLDANVVENDSLEIGLAVDLNSIDKYTDTVEEVGDTLCYGLSEQYKIINFYNNRIRIKNLSKPGSKLILTGDTLYYDNLKYLILSIDSKKEHIKLLNLNNNKDCYFFKD